MPQSQTMAPRERKTTREQEDNTIKAQNNDQTQTPQTMVATINNTFTTIERTGAVLN